MLIATFAHVVNPSMHPKLPFQTDKAFAPVVLIGRGPNVLVVRADSPYKSVKDVIVAARARPGKLTYASQGNGTSAHLAGEMFTNLAKVEMLHVPYRGASPAITDLLGGQIDLLFATLPSISAMLASGRVRPVAVTGTARSPLLPDVPTIAEGGVPGYQADVWYAVFAPAGTPAPVVRQLHAAFRHAAEADEFRRRASGEGLQVTLDGPEETARIVRAEEAKWRRVIREQSIQAD